MWLSELRAPLKALLSKAEVDSSVGTQAKSGNGSSDGTQAKTGNGSGDGTQAKTGECLEDGMNSQDALAGMIEMLDQMIEGRRKILYNLQSASSLSDEDKRKHKRVLRFLEERRKELFLRNFEESAAECIKQKYNLEVTRVKQETKRTGEQLHAMFSFAEQAFQNGNEMLILVTELTVGKYSSAYIATFGSEDYRRHNEELMLSERQSDLKSKIMELGL